MVIILLGATLIGFLVSGIGVYKNWPFYVYLPLSTFIGLIWGIVISLIWPL